MSLAKKINLKDEEKIIMVVRPYVLAYVWKYMLGGAFLLASSFFMFRLFFYSWWGDVIYVVGMLLGFYFILSALLKNRGNMLVVTSSRAVDIHRLGWFDEIISSVNYLDIKDIAIRKKGIWQSLFNVGGVSIITKSENFALEIFHIHNPAQIQNLLSDVSQQYKQDIKVSNSRVIYNNFIRIIPSLPDGDLQEVKRLINEQLEPNLNAQNSK
ncbi:MAG: hypothetical protein HYT15_02855 [Candidatus Magasanikbacteria bacterium]|nr:hypothetical protein [Candidatus Magasanikbacteria bacterium]